MGWDYTWDECETALKEGKTGSSPGLDGLPYELWKTLHERYEADSKKDVDRAFNADKVGIPLLPRYGSNTSRPSTLLSTPRSMTLSSPDVC